MLCPAVRNVAKTGIRHRQRPATAQIQAFRTISCTGKTTSGFFKSTSCLRPDLINDVQHCPTTTGLVTEASKSTYGHFRAIFACSGANGMWTARRHGKTTAGLPDVIPVRDPTPERTCAVPPYETWQKLAFATAGGPLQRKSGHFGPFPAQGKLLPVFQIYFLFKARPQKRCTALPDDNGTGNRGLQVHLRPFSSHLCHFGGQNWGRYGFLCPHGPQIPTSCTQFPITRST